MSSEALVVVTLGGQKLVGTMEGDINRQLDDMQGKGDYIELWGVRAVMERNEMNTQTNKIRRHVLLIPLDICKGPSRMMLCRPDSIRVLVDEDLKEMERLIEVSEKVEMVIRAEAAGIHTPGTH